VSSRSVVVRHPPHITILQPVAVALETDDLYMVHQPVDHRGGHGGVAEDLAPATEGLLEVTIALARSQRDDRS
jgi:hypothetical protein